MEKYLKMLIDKIELENLRLQNTNDRLCRECNRLKRENVTLRNAVAEFLGDKVTACKLLKFADVVQIKSETKIATRKGCDIYLQELKNDRYATHCVQYAGNGKCFKSLEEAEAYIFKRWRLAVNDVRPNAKGGD